MLSELTPAERAVALLVREGLSNREIADRLGREVWTIKSHLTRIFRKTGTRGRSELVRVLHMTGPISSADVLRSDGLDAEDFNDA